MPDPVRLGFPEVSLLAVRDLRQATNYTCGVAALQSVLAYFGIEPEAEAALARELGTTSRDGTDPDQITRVARRYGLTAQVKERMTLAELESHVRRGIPVIVAYQAWSDQAQVDWKRDWVDGHYSIVIGTDAHNVYLEDPSLAGTVGSIPRREFLERWHDTDRHDRRLHNLGIVLTRPGFTPTFRRPARITKIG